MQEAPVQQASASVEQADPSRALDSALGRCADESFFARPACEEQARARYCDGGSAESARCAQPARDYGQ
jgi:hypothetical protein